MKFYVGATILTLILLGLFTIPDPAAAASDVTCNSAVLSAWVDPQGSPTTAWMQWGTSPSLSGTTFSSTPQTFNNYETFSATATNLSENTTYYYRGRFNNASRGAWNGDIFSFKTLSCGGNPTTPTIVNLNFLVKNSCDNKAIQNADVHIGQNFGNGQDRTTDGNGFSNFGVNSGTNISWDVSASGYSNKSGTANSGNSESTVNVSITPTGGCYTAPQNTLPKGYLDGADCSAIWGWSVDYNLTGSPVHIEVDDVAGRSVITGLSNLYRSDVNSVLGLTGNHAFNIATPTSLKDGNAHIIYVYGVDIDASGNPTGDKFLLNGSPKTITCGGTTTKTDGRWSSWSAKSTQCGITDTQTRTCINPDGGRACTDPQNPNYDGEGYSRTYTTRSCNTSQPRDGGWSDWSTKSTQCGVSGTQTRTCTNPYPANGGAYCSGPSTQPYTNSPCSVNDPSVSLSANPSSIKSGESSYLSWTTSNANSCSASWTTSTAPAGSKTVYPTSTTTYSITCYGASGTTPATASTIVTVGNNAPTVSLTADDTNIDSGDSTMLRWSSTYADYCTASGAWSGGKGTGSNNSQSTGSLTNTKTYTITCYNNAGVSASDSVTVNVDDNNGSRPNVSIRADDTSIRSGDRTRLRWTVSNADSCRASDDWSGSKSRYGSSEYTDDLYDDSTFRITCTNENGSDSDEVTVRVEDDTSNRTCRDISALNYGGLLPCRYTPIVINNQPTVNVSADSTSLAYNGATNIRWFTTNATYCYASGGSAGWAGNKSIGPASFYTGSLTSGKTYTLTCMNNYGTATDSVYVNVRGLVINNPVTPTSYVIINSSVDRNQPIVPTIDNTRPHPGDQINYTVTYQNVGNSSITNLVLRLTLPYEVDYISSNPNNPNIVGNNLTFNLGTLRANAQGTVTVRVRVRDNIPLGTNLNFPAVLSYTDPFGNVQSVSANVEAQVWSEPVNPNYFDPNANQNNFQLGANVFGAGFLPTSLFGWLFLFILLLILIALARYLYSGIPPSFSRKITTTTIQH